MNKLALSLIVVAAVSVLLALSARKKDSEKETSGEDVEVIATECNAGAMRMFPEDEPAEKEKFERCMGKKLGADWRTDHPKLTTKVPVENP